MSTEDTPHVDSQLSSRECVEKTYRDNPELALKAYHREYNYRKAVAEHIHSKYDQQVPESTIHNLTLELSYLGLIPEYAQID